MRSPTLLGSTLLVPLVSISLGRPAVCATTELAFLTRAAARVASPADEADLRIGLAALDALGRIHPADLGARLAPLRDKNARPPVRNAANRALADAGTCAPTK